MFLEQLDRFKTHLRPEAELRGALAKIWARVGEERRDEITREAERYVRLPLPVWTAGSMLRAAGEYQEGYKTRRQMLQAFVLCACARDTSRYDERIADLAWAISEEASWACAPLALLNAQNIFAPDAAASAETLAWTLALAVKPISRVSDAIDERVRREITRRVSDVIIKSTEKPKADMRSLAALATAVLLAERDSAKRWGATRKLLIWMDARANELGSTSVSEWTGEACGLMDALTLASFATANEVDLRRMLKSMSYMPLYANLGGGYFLNTGENDIYPALSGEAIYRFGRGGGNEALRALGGEAARLRSGKPAPAGGMTERVMGLLYEADIKRDTLRSPGMMTGLLRDSGIAVARTDSFTAMIHDMDSTGAHLDAGDFILMYRGRPVTLDAGPGFKETSMHNLPTVGIEGQAVRGRIMDLDFSVQGDDYVIGADISPAYPEKLGIISWQRTAVLSRRERIVKLIEVFDLTRARQDLKFNFILPTRPNMQPNIAIIGGVALEWEDGLVATVEDISSESLRAWRMMFSLARPMRSGNATFIFRPLD